MLEASREAARREVILFSIGLGMGLAMGLSAFDAWMDGFIHAYGSRARAGSCLIYYVDI